MVIIKTIDNKLFNIDINIARYLNILNTMYDCLGENNEDEILLELSSSSFEKVIEWVSYHKTPETDNNVNLWHDNFLNKLSIFELYSLLSVADYLEIFDLINCISKKIADEVHNSPIPNIYKLFSPIINLLSDKNTDQ